MRDLGIINPDKVTTCSFETIKSLSKQFPQLDLAGSESIDGLRDEFMDVTLSPLDHPVVEFLFMVGRIMTLDGQQRFPLLARLMAD